MSRKDIVSCEVCGCIGPKCIKGYYEPWYDWSGKLHDESNIDRGNPEGGHRLKYIYKPANTPQGFVQVGITLCAPCHSIVAYDGSKKSVYNSREEFQNHINKQQWFHAWAKTYTNPAQASCIMLYSHNFKPFKKGMVMNIPGSDNPTTKGNIWEKSKFEYVMITKVITDTVPSWANDTQHSANPKYEHDKFIYIKGTKPRLFNVYVETIPYELAKKNAALKILKWWRKIRSV